MKHVAHLISPVVTTLVVAAIACAPGCGSRNSSTGFADRDAGDASLAPSLGGGNDDDGGGSLPPLTAQDAACASVREQAVATPLDLYVMLEKSNSLLAGSPVTKWKVAVDGLNAFTNDPRSSGVRVALNFFPRAPDATPACDQVAYRTPRVPFDALPANAMPFGTALGREQPDGFQTPVYPALGGALLGASAEAQRRPGDVGAVLLITAAEPVGPASSCSGVDPADVANIEALAARGASQLGVRTYVIALPGVPPASPNRIAAAGGTGSALVVGDANAQSDFQAALEAVRGRALPCEFGLPPKVADKTFAYDRVNVARTTGAATATLPQSRDCAGGAGWRYDDAATPSKIVLCPATCESIRTDFTAKIEILLGCVTVLK